MSITEIYIFRSTTFSYQLSVNGNRRNRGSATRLTTLAKKEDSDFPENSRADENKPIFASKRLLPQAAIGVFTLGFIDAGYSGDWSRIGVISKETESLLKFGAFLVVPFCVFLIVSLSNLKTED